MYRVEQPRTIAKCSLWSSNSKNCSCQADIILVIYACPESVERRRTTKLERMGLFLLISTELPFLPSSEKEVRAIRFYLKGKTVI